MLPNIKQMLSYIKMRGYKGSKDVLGVYFDRQNRKFSAMKTGSWYTCYHNIKVDNQWVLVSKSMVFSSYQEALNWIVTEMQKVNE